ncbi:MAG: iron transporter [Candidatus Binatia bacterium]|nr:MAG: iron transporter [Candidatus Binatia bacterium]
MSHKRNPNENEIPLQKLAEGRWARLADHFAPNVSRRLLDLGFVPGTRLKIVRRAPLGDPVEIEIRGTRLCFRRNQLRGLRVIVESEGA